jgi:hypothetical protein
LFLRLNVHFPSPALASRPACFPPCLNGNAIRRQSDPYRGPRGSTLVVPAFSFSRRDLT